jgi:hypothetical protein
MSLRDILVFLDGNGASEGRLQLATNIARDHDACLSAVLLQNGHATGSRSRIAAPSLSARTASRRRGGGDDRTGPPQGFGAWLCIDGACCPPFGPPWHLYTGSPGPSLGPRHIRRAAIEISRSRRRFERCGSQPSFPATRNSARWRQPGAVPAHDPPGANVTLIYGMRTTATACCGQTHDLVHRISNRRTAEPRGSASGHRS